MGGAGQFLPLRLGPPVHRLLVPVPVVSFVATLATDIAYCATGDVSWARLSLWLLGAGLSVGLLAASVGLLAFMGHPEADKLSGFVHFLAGAGAMLTAMWNFGVRMVPAPGGLWPWGLMLSVLTVVWMLPLGWHGVALARRRTGDPRKAAGSAGG